MEYKERNGKIIERLFKSSVISLIITSIAAMLGIVIDGVVIGRFLGPESMAAYGLVTPVVNVATIFSGVFSTGTQVVCAQKLGAGDAEGARRTFSMCVIITVFVAVLLTAGVIIFRTPIAVFLGARDASAYLLPYATDYMLGMSFALLPVIFLFEFNAVMRLDGDAARVVIAVAVMTLLDVIGDLVNALVIHGGMFGMGMATFISYLVAFVIMILHFTKKDIIFKFTTKGVKMSDLRDILITGSSSAVGSASSALRNTVLNRVMVATAFSGIAVGALSVVNTVINFASCVMIGIGLTTAMIAGMIVGDQDRSAAEDLVKVTLRTDLLIGAVLGGLIFIFSGTIASVFGNADGADMVRLAARGLRFYAVSVVLYGINNSFVNYMQGLRRMNYAAIYGFLENFVFIALPALALVGRFDTDAVWAGFLIGEILTLGLIIAAAAVRKKGVPARAKDFLFLKEPFGAPEEETFEVSIFDQSQVMPAATALESFCKEKNATARDRMLLSLFVEELGNNVVTHGFRKSRGKNLGLDIRVVHWPDGWTMRFRDNCRAFDPTEWIRIHEKKDSVSNVGIRMVCGMAKEVRYVSTMDLNILTLGL